MFADRNESETACDWSDTVDAFVVIRRLVKYSLQRCATPLRSWNANASRSREWRPRNRSRPFSLVHSLLCPAIVFHETDSFIFRRFNRCLFGRPDRITYRGHDAGYRCKLVLVFRLLITSWLNDGVRSLIEGLGEEKPMGNTFLLWLNSV